MAASVIVISKRATSQQKKLADQGYLIIDVTSNSADDTFRKFSPFYPHKDIPVPGSNTTAASVEGIWQGLKVFENEGIDSKKFNIKSMKNLKRPITEKRGRVLGHAYESRILTYKEARELIYLPVYTFVLQNKLQNEVSLLRGLLQEGKQIALLDYETNCDVNDTSKPLSHASLVAKAITSP